MRKSWLVTVKFKNSSEVEYIYEGGEEEARKDAYLSYPQGTIKNVIVTEYDENNF